MTRHDHAMLQRTVLMVCLICAGCMGGVGFSGVVGSGVAKTETRDVGGGFKRIRLDVSPTFHVPIGDKQSLTVTADDNILPVIETTLEGDELHIGSHESYSPKISVKIDIVMSSLEALAINGSGDVSIAGLE